MKNLSELKNLSEDTENKNDSRNDFALYEGRLIGSLEIATVGKGRIELNFSDELLLVITLELIIVPPTALLPLSAPALPSRVSTNEKINDDTSTSNDDGNKKISNANDLKWLTRLLFNSILQAQLLLLSHWKKSLDLLQESARQERERERESSITTAATSTKSDSSSKSSDVMIKIEKIEHKVMVAIKTENTTTKPTNNSPNIPTASSLVEVSSKEHCSENHSVSLSSVNFFHRLVNPVLRGRARDVGDGIANALASTGEWNNSLYFDKLIVFDTLSWQCAKKLQVGSDYHNINFKYYITINIITNNFINIIIIVMMILIVMFVMKNIGVLISESLFSCPASLRPIYVLCIITQIYLNFYFNFYYFHHIFYLLPYVEKLF